MFKRVLSPNSFRATTRTMATINSSSGGSANPSSEHKAIIDDVLRLYQCKPSDSVYSRYSQTAVFHDPVSIAKGLDSIKSQFNGMPKIFEKSTTEKYDVLPSSSENSIILDLTQHYVFKGGDNTPEKTVNSKITLKLDQDGKIEHHEEEWDHEPNKTGEDGFLGKLQELRKKFSAKVVEGMVDSDPKKL